MTGDIFLLLPLSFFVLFCLPPPRCPQYLVYFKQNNCVRTVCLRALSRPRCFQTRGKWATLTPKSLVISNQISLLPLSLFRVEFIQKKINYFLASTWLRGIEIHGFRKPKIGKSFLKNGSVFSVFLAAFTFHNPALSFLLCPSTSLQNCINRILVEFFLNINHNLLSPPTKKSWQCGPGRADANTDQSDLIFMQIL